MSSHERLNKAGEEAETYGIDRSKTKVLRLTGLEPLFLSKITAG